MSFVKSAAVSCGLPVSALAWEPLAAAIDALDGAPPPVEVQAASRAEIAAAVAARTARPRAPPCLDVDCIYLFPSRRTASISTPWLFGDTKANPQALAARPGEVS